VAGFEVRFLRIAAVAYDVIIKTRCRVHSCVQAAAAARVADGPGILKSAENGDGASVLCHLIVDAESVSMQDEE
jgi:hypothetical protein